MESFENMWSPQKERYDVHCELKYKAVFLIDLHPKEMQNHISK